MMLNAWCRASLCICLRYGTITLSSERLGTMGYALCAGIAASIDRPKSKVVVVAGDGGFQMTMNELGTAVNSSYPSFELQRRKDHYLLPCV